MLYCYMTLLCKYLIKNYVVKIDSSLVRLSYVLSDSIHLLC